MELELKRLMDLVSRPLSPIFDPEYLLRPCVDLNKNVKQGPRQGSDDAVRLKDRISTPIDPEHRRAVSRYGNASNNTVGSTIPRLYPSAIPGDRPGDSVAFSIDAESQDMGRKRERQELENNELRKAKKAKYDSQYYPGYPMQEQQLTGKRNVHLLTTKNRIAGAPETKSIEIDGVSREIRSYGEHAVILMDWNDPRTITYGEGKCNIIFDEGKYVIPMKIGEDYRKFNIGGETHRVKLGVPTQELMFDGVGYQCAFGGKPVTVHMGGRLRTIRLDGKTPKVNISNTKNTDFLAGKIQLEINSNVIDVFLDSKPQRFYIDGKQFVVRGIIPESHKDLDVPVHLADSSKRPTHSSMRPCNNPNGISIPCNGPSFQKPASQGFPPQNLPSHSSCPIVPQASPTMAPKKGTSATCNASQLPLLLGLATLPGAQANMRHPQYTIPDSCVTNQLPTNMVKISRPTPKVPPDHALAKVQDKKCENKEQERFLPQVQELLAKEIMQEPLPKRSNAGRHHVGEMLQMTLPKQYSDCQGYLPNNVSALKPSHKLSAPKDVPQEKSPHAEFTVSQGHPSNDTSSEKPPHTDDKIKANSDKKHKKHPQNSTSSGTTDKKKDEKHSSSADPNDKNQEKQSLGSISSGTSDKKELVKHTICFGSITNKDDEHSSSTVNTDKKNEKHFSIFRTSGTTDKKEEGKLFTSSGTTDIKKEKKHSTSSGITDKKKEEKHSPRSDETDKKKKEKHSTKSATFDKKEIKQSTSSGTTNRKKEQKNLSRSGTTDKKKEDKHSIRSVTIDKKKQDKRSTSSSPTDKKKDKQPTSSGTTDKKKQEKYPATFGTRDKKKVEKQSNCSGNTYRKKGNDNKTKLVKTETKLEDTRKYDKKSFEYMLNMHG